MTRAEITFDILSYWHAGSGSGQGADLDAVVVKSPGGVPYLPGKTVKGLCREAMETLADLERVDARQVLAWFGGNAPEPLVGGERPEQVPSAGRYATQSGALRFSNAVPDIDDEWARANPSAISVLYAELAATKIADNGLADNKTLRKIEVAIPLTLTATVEADDDNGWVKKLEEAAPLIRALGSHRRRGLGRVNVTVKGGKS